MKELKIGDFNELEVLQIMDFGVYLTEGSSKILLPKHNVPAHTKIGDKLTVFVYSNSDGRPVATTMKPKAVIEDFECLSVKNVTDFGAFLDWGIDKDLFVPFKEMEQRMEVGKKYVVRVCLDLQTNRVFAASCLSKYIISATSRVEEGQKVKLLIYEKHELGFKTIVDDLYSGMIYYNEVFEDLQIGDKREGYIKKIREDGKLDISLQPPGFKAIVEAKDPIIEKLEKANGFLSYHDKSSPEDIKNIFNMSKKAYKKAIGSLYKESKIIIKDNGIYLKKD